MRLFATTEFHPRSPTRRSPSTIVACFVLGALVSFSSFASCIFLLRSLLCSTVVYLTRTAREYLASVYMDIESSLECTRLSLRDYFFECSVVFSMMTQRSTSASRPQSALSLCSQAISRPISNLFFSLPFLFGHISRNGAPSISSRRSAFTQPSHKHFSFFLSFQDYLRDTQERVRRRTVQVTTPQGGRVRQKHSGAMRSVQLRKRESRQDASQTLELGNNSQNLLVSFVPSKCNIQTRN